jgi:LysR family transcriptional regulator, benzoate and cis,cis-muconate-responsive activator of ben and cat genes
MELRHLRYFVAVAEEENVSRAASKLHISQPGISRQIHNLEAEIGFPLFERGGKSVRLTVAGKIFFGEAHDILQRTADAVEKARVGLAFQAEINVGYAPSGTVEIVPRALRAFRRSFPGVRVTLHDLSAKEMLPLLLQKKLDVALTLPPHKLPRELNIKELERYEACVVVGITHPLAKSKFVSLNQMASEPVAALARKDYPPSPRTSQNAVRHHRPQAAHQQRARQRDQPDGRCRGRARTYPPAELRQSRGWAALKTLEAAPRASALVDRCPLAQRR